MARKRKQQERKKKQRGGKRRRTMARRADKYDLYERSVQEPEADSPFVARVFRRHYGRPARTLREDFCGTAAFACQWVKDDPENRAIGIDLDPEPLQWGREHNVSKLTAEQASRVKLVQGDVLDVADGDVDVTVAFNFSYMVFQQRAELLRYFRRARSTLGAEGLFFLDVYGGADAQKSLEEERELDGFSYVWEQARFDPIHHHAVNYIHFEFDDGSRLRRCFKYDWRLWSIPEMRDVLAEAGFSSSEVYWEGTDAKTNEGNGVFIRRERAEDDPAWIAYVVGVA